MPDDELSTSVSVDAAAAADALAGNAEEETSPADSVASAAGGSAALPRRTMPSRGSQERQRFDSAMARAAEAEAQARADIAQFRADEARKMAAARVRQARANARAAMARAARAASIGQGRIPSDPLHVYQAPMDDEIEGPSGPTITYGGVSEEEAAAARERLESNRATGIPIGQYGYRGEDRSYWENPPPPPETDAQRARREREEARSAEESARLRAINEETAQQIGRHVTERQYRQRLRERGEPLSGLTAYNKGLLQAHIEAGTATAAEVDRAEVNTLLSDLAPQATVGPAARATEMSLFDRLGGSWGLGFGGMMSVGALTRALTPWASGQRYQSDAMAAGAISSMLPIAGAAGGSLIGSMFGPAGIMAGQFIGQSVGQGADTLLMANLESRIFGPERAGQEMGWGYGGESAVQRLTQILENLTTPAITELTDALKNMAESGVIGPGAAQGLVGLQSALGYGFTGAVQGVEGALQSNPGYFPLLEQFNNYGVGGKHGLTSNQLKSLSLQLAASGDMPDARKVIGAYSGSIEHRPEDQPSTEGIAGAITRFGAGLALGYHALVGGGDEGAIKRDLQVRYGAGSEVDPDSPNFNPQVARRVLAGNIFGFSQARIDNLIAQWQKTPKHVRQKQEAAAALVTTTGEQAEQQQFGEMSGEAALKATLAGVSLKVARGTTASEFTALGPAVRDAAQAAVSAAQSHVDLLEHLLSNEHDPTMRSMYRFQIANAKATLAQEQIAPAEFAREAFQRRVGEREAGYGAGLATVGEKIESGLLSGESYSDLHGMYELRYSTQMGQANWYEQMAKLGQEGKLPMSGQDVKAYFAAAAASRMRAREQRHQAEVTLPNEQELSKADLNIADARTNLQITSISGSRPQIDAAEVAVPQAYADKVADLNRIIAAGNMPLDERIQAEKDLAQATGDSIKAVKHSADLIEPATFQASMLRDVGAMNRASYSFMEPGNVNDLRRKVIGDITKELSDLETTREAALAAIKAPIVGPNGKTVSVQDQRNLVNLDYEEQHQKLLDQRAQAAMQMDREYFSRLPSLTVGGISFAMRALPAPSQVAANLERRGYGEMSAFNFGYFDSSTYDRILAQPGSALLTAGKSPSQIEPGNQTIQVLAQALQAGAAGAKYEINLSINGVKIPVPQAAATKAVQKSSRTSGMGTHYPGVP
ncbi:MAG: hypothetical protein KGL39_27795 [Patescibacteria group bacterium]|nr:hypothetical protein [Patescibacteria group bacterium]